MNIEKIFLNKKRNKGIIKAIDYLEKKYKILEYDLKNNVLRALFLSSEPIELIQNEYKQLLILNLYSNESTLILQEPFLESKKKNDYNSYKCDEFKKEIAYIVEKDAENYLFLNYKQLDFPKHLLIKDLYFINKDWLILVASSTYIEPSLFLYQISKHLLLKYEEKKKKFEDIIIENEFVHKYLSQNKTPFLISKYKSQDFIIILHGGPHAHFNKSFHRLTYQLLNNNYSVILFNYSGSTGYTMSFEKSLYKNAGVKDLEEVCELIQWIKKNYKNVNLKIYGDSYGGYLAAMTATQKIDILKKIVVTGAFSNIRIMEILSNSRELISNLFSSEYFLSLDEQYRKIGVNTPVHFIHGQCDDHSPIVQIRRIAEEFPEIYLSEYPDFGHYEIDVEKMLQKEDIILKSLK